MFPPTYSRDAAIKRSSNLNILTGKYSVPTKSKLQNNLY